MNADDLAQAMPYAWWWRWRKDGESHVIKICWDHAAEAAGHGWQPGAADLWENLDLSEQERQTDVCVACDSGFDLAKGRST